MNKGRQRTCGLRYDGLRRVLIFFFFLGGSVLGKNLFADIYRENSTIFESIFIFSVPLGISLILSASLLGAALIPLCSFAMGGISGLSVSRIWTGYLNGAGLELKLALINAIIVPVFFAAAVRGMGASSILYMALDKHNSTTRAAYCREYLPIILSAASAVLILYFIAG